MLLQKYCTIIHSSFSITKSLNIMDTPTAGIVFINDGAIPAYSDRTPPSPAIVWRHFHVLPEASPTCILLRNMSRGYTTDWAAIPATPPHARNKPNEGPMANNPFLLVAKVLVVE